MAEQSKNVDRREFLAASVAAGIGAGVEASAVSTSRTGHVLGANDRIRLGVIGVGNRGTQLLEMFLDTVFIEIQVLFN